MRVFCIFFHSDSLTEPFFPYKWQGEIEYLNAEDWRLDNCIRFGNNLSSTREMFLSFLLYECEHESNFHYREKLEQIRTLESDVNCQKYALFLFMQFFLFWKCDQFLKIIWFDSSGASFWRRKISWACLISGYVTYFLHLWFVMVSQFSKVFVAFVTGQNCYCYKSSRC